MGIFFRHFVRQQSPPKDVPGLIREISDGHHELMDVLEAQLSNLRLFAKLAEPEPIPGRPSMPGDVAIHTHMLGKRQLLVFFVDPHDPRMLPYYGEFTMSEALDTMEQMPGAAGFLLVNSDGSFVDYEKADFPRLREVLDLTGRAKP